MPANGVTNIIKNLEVLFTKNAPHILTGLGCVGVISTAVLASKASPRALMIIKHEEEYREQKKFNSMTKMDKFKLTWKCYIPVVAVGATTVGCIVGANTVHTTRNAALASLYALTDSAFREYKTKVIQEIGKTKEIKIRDEVAKDRIASNPPNSSNIIMSGTGEVLCYDSLSGRYFMSSYETIRQKFNDLNYKLRSEMRMDLNELYYELNLPLIELGKLVGFNLEKSQIEPIYSTQLDNNGRPCLVIDVDVYPNFY